MHKEILLSVYNELIKGASIQKLIDIMCAYLGNPIALCDCNLNPVAHSQNKDIDDFVWKCATSDDRNLHYEFEAFGKKSGILYKVRNSRSPVLISDIHLVHRYLNMSLYSGDNNIGNVILLEYYQDFREDDANLFEQFSQILAFAMNKIIPEYAQNSNSALVMEQLLNGVHVPKTDVERHLFKPNPEMFYTVVVLKYKQKHISHRPLALEFNMLTQKYPTQKVSIYNDTLVMLFQVPRALVKTNNDWKKLAQVADKMNLLMGVSNPFSEITELSLYYDQALNAIKYGEQYINDGNCYFWQDLSFYYLLTVVQQDGTLAKFLHPAIIDILEYDIQYGTKWVRTLYYYLYFNRDINAAATAMGLNRNSMYYRINKIQELMGHDFQSNNFVTTMKFSVNILIFLEGEAFFDKHEIPVELRIMSFF